MDPTTQAFLAAILGAVVAGGAVLAWHISDRQQHMVQPVEDPVVPPEAVDAFESELRTVPELDWQVVTYSGSMHTFTEPGTDAPDHGAQFNAVAEARSWQAMKNFFAEAL